MEALRIVLIIALLLDSIVMSVLVLMQEGKSDGLGAIAGVGASTDTYWGKNKSRSMEGKLIQLTKLCGILFFLLSMALNIRF